jgi:hypothetical protein
MAYDPRDLDQTTADAESAPPVYNWRWFTTSLVILAALLILEMGIHPAFAAVMLCFKLSLPDLLNAWWLIRRDPDRSRGTLVAAFYVARSFWSVVVWSFLLAIGLAFAVTLLAGNRGRGQGAEIIVGALGLTFLFMFVVAGSLTLLICLVAAWNRTRIWLGPGVTPWRQADRFPPFIGLPNPANNGLPAFIAFGALVLSGLCVAAAVSWIVILLDKPAANQNDWFILAPTLFLFALPVAAFMAANRIHYRIAARRPTECWPDETPLEDDEPDYDSDHDYDFDDIDDDEP